MPPNGALAVCILFIALVFRLESKSGGKNASSALWLPSIWLALTVIKPVSFWLSKLGISGAQPALSVDSVAEGSGIDRLVFVLLILCAYLTLYRRSPPWPEIYRRNRWLVLLLLYCLLSIAWADHTEVSAKRCFKETGNFVMALVVLTERNQSRALNYVLGRVFYVLIPLSVVLLKYFPDLGRNYNPWTGLPAWSGVAHGKNALGYLCLTAGLFFIWRLTKNTTQELKGKVKYLSLCYLVMIVYLMSFLDSITSLICLVVGAGLLLAIQVHGDRLFSYSIEVLVLLGVLTVFGLQRFNLVGDLLAYFGRDSTLTGRTELWESTLKLHDSPILGTGFGDFWIGQRLESLWSEYSWFPNQAHNGYLEVYLNLGIVGFSLLVLFLITGYRNLRHSVISNSYPYQFGYVFFIIAFFFNISEAAFLRAHLIWFVLLIVSIEIPAVKSNMNRK